MKTMLFIDGLEVFANHGLFEEENKLGQKFIFWYWVWIEL